MVRVRERVGHRELRAVRDAEERDLVEAERLADGLEVFRVVGGAVEVALRPELRRRTRWLRPAAVSAVIGRCSDGQSSRPESPVPRSS